MLGSLHWDRVTINRDAKYYTSLNPDIKNFNLNKETKKSPFAKHLSCAYNVTDTLLDRQWWGSDSIVQKYVEKHKDNEREKKCRRNFILYRLEV